MKKIGVLVVEDSDVVRQLLEHIIGSDARLEVLAAVSTAEEALRILGRIKPDVISLDIRLPGMDGFEATRRIMRERPTPIVVCSASVESEDLKITMNALRAGALAVVEKPVGTTRDDYDRLARTLCTQLAIMSDVKVVRQTTFAETKRVSPAHASPLPGFKMRSPGPALTGKTLRVVGIGASTGGPNAVVQVLGELGADFPLPVLLVQHIMPSFLPGFVTWLDGVTPFRAVVARTGEVPLPGTVYLAPADFHLRMEADRIRLTRDSPVSSQRPSATTMFESMARSTGSAALGILLTGMGDDGAEGLLQLRIAGGYTIAEHESTAVVYGMPKAAVDRGAACECLALGEIAPRVTELISSGREV
jgi:two-component system, chemotaxis family, protein-glutamate methylesterase/glutaminase